MASGARAVPEIGQHEPSAPWREFALGGPLARPFPFARAAGAERQPMAPGACAMLAARPLRHLADAQSVPIGAAFLAAFAALLARFRGQEEVHLVLLRPGRALVPIGLAIPGTESLAATLAAATEHLAAADEARRGSTPNVGHIAFGFELREEGAPPSCSAAPFALCLAVVCGAEQCRLELHHDARALDLTDVHHLLDHLVAILEDATRAPHRPIAELGLTSATACTPSIPRSEPPPLAHVAIRARAAEHPEKPAVVSSRATWSYATLVERADAIARGLIGAGVRPGYRVALLLDRTPDLIAAHLGVLMAAAAFVPLDPTTPRARLVQLLARTAPRLVLIDGPGLSDLDPRVITIEALLERADPDTQAPSADVDAEQPAYAMTTSGSTGLPKAVLISHANLAWFVHLIAGPLDVRAEDRYLHAASTAFTPSVRQLFLTLTRGATLVLADADERVSPLALLELIRRERVSLIDLVPSQWASLVEALRAVEPIERARLLGNELRQVVTVGEPLPADLARAWREELGHPARLVNIYGQTETTGLVAHHTITTPIPDQPVLPVGQPVPGIELSIRDAQGRPLPSLAPGEVWVEGPTVALGYSEPLADGQERFSSDPARPGLRRYRTGDLGFFRLDGTLELLGRADEQLKIRGSRLEPAEVEAALRSHPCVREAAVLVDSAGTGEQRLIGAFVPRSQPPPDECALREHLQALLPAYMVPDLLRPLEALPFTATGKLDRRALLARVGHVSPAGGADESLEKRTDIGQWFYVPTWRAAPRPRRESLAKLDGRWLVFEDACGLASRALAPEWDSAVRVRPGTGFRALSPELFEIEPGNAEHYDRLFAVLAEERRLPAAVAHCWNVTAPGAPAALHSSYWSVVHLVGALTRRGVLAPVQVVASELERTPAKRTLLGPVACLPHEPDDLVARSLEVELEGAGVASPALIEAVRVELLDPGAETELQLRSDGQRLVRDYAPLPLPARRTNASNGAAARGAWVITGGLGGIGLEIALHLARTTRAPLVLVGSSEPPVRARTDDPVVRRQLERLSALEATGVPFCLARADVTDRDALREVFESAVREHGRLAGVIHAAGRRTEGCLVKDESPRSSEPVLAPKVAGTEALGEVLAGLPPAVRPDQLVLFGSLVTAVSRRGFSSYLAANAWLDAAALRFGEQGLARRVLALHWDTWTAVGRAADEVVAPELRERHAQRLARGIATEEGLDAFDRALASDELRLFVSTLDLSLRRAAAFGGDHGGRTRAADSLERELVSLWEELLARTGLSTTASFFLVGGHSLLAVRLLARVQSRWGRAPSLSSFFAEPTIAGLARRLRATDGDGARAEPDALPPFPAPAPRRDRHPLTRAQEGVWLEHERDPHDSCWNLPCAWRLRGRLDVELLERALARLVQRHSALWTQLQRHPEGLEARPSTMPFRLERVRLPAADAADRFVAVRASCPFDLAREVPFRAALGRLADDDHILLLNAHHVVCDGGSQAVLVRELSALHAALSVGRSDPLPPLAHTFADFARWERALEAKAEDVEWFRARLRPASPVLDLPLERPARPPAARGARHRFVVPAELRARLEALARAEGATLFMALLAGFQALLHRWSGEDTIVVGAPFALRDDPETEHMVGLLLNTLVLATDCSGDPTFAELLARVREVALGAYARRHVPFGELVSQLAPARLPDRHPIYQVMFGYEQHPAGTLALAGVEATPLETDSQGAVSELSLALEDQPHGLLGCLEYRADRFTAAAIERLVRCWLLLLESATTDPARRLSRLELVAPAERARLLEWGRGPAAPIPAVRVDELVRARAARAPRSTALIWRGGAISAGDLAARASALAAHLRQRGVGPGHLVAVCLPRSPALAVAILGTLEAGAAYLPLDPADPALRRERILRAAAPALVVANDPALVGPTCLRLDLDGRALPAHEVEPISSQPGRLPADAVYVVYTSGSTGEPKGVIGRHPGLVNRLLWAQSLGPLQPDDVTCLRTSPSFVDAVCELFAPLVAGAPALVIEHDDARDPARLVALLATHGVTRLVLVPALLRALLDAQARSRTPLPRLRVIVSSGEALPLPLARRCREQLPQARLLNLYGSTEVAADATWFDLVELAPDAAAVPLGRPIQNLSARVLDRHGDFVPVGIPGELHVGGAGLAAGYLDRADFTAERFVADPHAAGELVYRTGDLASWSSDGTLAFHGRVDRQLKVRGVRVEPDEVARAIADCPGVREVAVLPGLDPRGEPCLIAYVAPSEAAVGLHRALVDRLPRAMLPARIVPLETLPRTPSGKPDPERFPPPPPAVPRGRTPSDGMERRIATMWAELLALEPDAVGAEDDFFALGGHSLLAVDLAARIADELGRTVPLATLFEHPTVAEQAALIDRLGARYRSLVALQPNGSRPPLFCIHPGGGEALAFRNLARHLGPDQPVYGFQAQGLDGRDAPLDRVEDMGRVYVSELRRVQPQGPYQLLGRCFGGLVALEMACQLEQAGHRVVLLAIVGWLRPPEVSRLARVRRVVANLLDHPPSGWLPHLRKVLRTRAESRRRLAGGSTNGNGSGKGDRKSVRGASGMALLAYRGGRSYSGPLLLIQPADVTQCPAREREHRGWDLIAPGRLERVLLPQAHGEMLREPQVAELARTLTSRLSPGSTSVAAKADGRS